MRYMQYYAAGRQCCRSAPVKRCSSAAICCLRSHCRSLIVAQKYCMSCSQRRAAFGSTESAALSGDAAATMGTGHLGRQVCVSGTEASPRHPALLVSGARSCSNECHISTQQVRCRGCTERPWGSWQPQGRLHCSLRMRLVRTSFRVQCDYDMPVHIGWKYHEAMPALVCGGILGQSQM
jgi:hypothetical protein